MIKIKADKDNLQKELVSAVRFKKRRLKSKKESRDAGVASAIALFGMVGWSIVVPLVLFIIIGQFFVKKFGMDTSVLLNFILFGFLIGIYNTIREFRKSVKKGFNKKKKEGE